MYKKILLSFLAVATSAFSIKPETPPSFRHEFSLGIESIKYFYKEPDIYQDPDDRHAYWMDDTGNLYGLNGSYRLTWKDVLFIQPEGRILYGKHDYRTGRKERVNFYSKRSIPALIYEPRLIVGGKIPLVHELIFSPYTGIGYRFKNDDSEEVKINNGRTIGFYRKSNYVYIPFGAYVYYAINDTWSASLKGEYDWMIKGWHYSRRLDNGAKTFKQPNGYGLKGEASVSYLYNKLKFSVSPYLNYWNIRNSKEINGGMEPYNLTWESGIKLGVTF